MALDKGTNLKELSKARSSGLRRTGEVGFVDEFKTLSKHRENMSRIRGQPSKYRAPGQKVADFLDLISLVCGIYQDYDVENLIPMQHFHRTWELDEDAGHTCIVTSREISSPTPSTTNRGETEITDEKVIVKRTRKGMFGSEGSAFRTLINELRIRSHPPLRNHPNIVNLKGIAWDFENDEETKPVPLLVEEIAPHRALETFWDAQDLVRMPLIIKTNLCRDIAEGISALHACGIAHGDIKPGNILIFPATMTGGSSSGTTKFLAKLTDFGHSVFEFDDDPTLPIWTPVWSAPEADPETPARERIKSFEDTMATDVYSFGLVAVSVIIGRSIVSGKFPELPEEIIATSKVEDTLMDRVMEVVTREDRTQPDSDFDLGVIRSLLRSCLRRAPSSRSMPRCLAVLRDYENACSTQRSEYFSWEARFIPQKIEVLSTTRPPLIGYRTLQKTSHLVKSKIVTELKTSATDRGDRRQAACAWELFICYFSGFGVRKDLSEARHWLTEACTQGLELAQAFYYRLHSAMDVNPVTTLRDLKSYSHEDAVARVSEWMTHAVSIGCVDILPDIQQFDQENDVSNLSSAMEFLRRQWCRGFTPKTLDQDGSFLCQVVMGNRERLDSMLGSNAQGLKEVDASGDNAIILAAKYGNFDVLLWLLQQPAANPSHLNNKQQSVLHYLTAFQPDQIQKLVPLLVDRGVDIAQEGLAVEYSPDAPTFSVPTRCSPIMNAIMAQNQALLDALLEASHSEGSLFPCEVCEAGSRFRKILAAATALQSYWGIELLHSHLEKHGKGELAVFDRIEVWYRKERVPLQQVPFHGILLRGKDLPESLLRAIHHGENHVAALTRTVDIILDKAPDRLGSLYEMVIDSVLCNSVDALDYLLNIRAGFTNEELWSYAIKHDFYENPIFSSIRCGFRDVFEKLAGSRGRNICHLPTGTKCVRPCCVGREEKLHRLNMAHVCLSVAVTAAHHDQFFVEFILRECPEALVLAQPTASDEELSGQPSAFMAQAILTSSFRSSHLIAVKYPGVLGQLVPLLPRLKRIAKSKSYTLASNSPVLSKDSICPVGFVPLPEYILFIGSYDNCRLLQTLRAKAGPKPTMPAIACPYGRRRSTDVELGTVGAQAGSPDCRETTDTNIINWKDFPLSTSEFHWLLVGLIADDWSDRHSLWEFVGRKLDSGAHGKYLDMSYLRLAVRYANFNAVNEICKVSEPSVMRRQHRLSEALFSTLDLALSIRDWNMSLFPLMWVEVRFLRVVRAREISFNKTTDAQKAAVQRIVTLLKAQSFHSSFPVRLFTISYLLSALIVALSFLLVSFLIIPLPTLFPALKHRGENSSTPPNLGLVLFESVGDTITSFIMLPLLVKSILSRSTFGCINSRLFSTDIVSNAHLRSVILCLGVGIFFFSLPMLLWLIHDVQLPEPLVGLVIMYGACPLALLTSGVYAVGRAISKYLSKKDDGGRGVLGA